MRHAVWLFSCTNSPPHLRILHSDVIMMNAALWIESIDYEVKGDDWVLELVLG